MAGQSNSTSRLGVTLQGYDQVIALSQANINESLEYHFSVKPELCDFNVTVKTLSAPAQKLIATIKPPTVEMVDKENADQALYVLTFVKGDYSYMDFSDPDDEGDGKRVKVSVKGWKFAFYVDFSLKKMGTVPDKIAKAIQNPGCYSVDQLLIDFGTADLMNFDWERSKITGFKDSSAVRATMTLFVSEWLNSLKTKDRIEEHKVIGYAVKLDTEKAGMSLADTLQKVSPAAPSFPPTSVRLQTINYRPDGDPAKSQTSHDFNAFLFTEMTGNRPMINKDLAWSGDLFYESIGGTLIMSRSIFWDQFLKPKLQEICKRNLDVAQKSWYDWSKYNMVEAVQNVTQEAPLSWSEDGLICSSFAKISIDSWDYLFEKAKDVIKNKKTLDAKVSDQIEVLVGESRVKLSHKIESVYFSETLGGGSKREETTIKWDDYVNLKSVTTDGTLKVEVTSKANNQSKGSVSENGVPTPEAILDAIKSGNYKFTETLKAEIERALNVQGCFVFPGGGDFEMKDPIFNKAGDLMIGLTYKKGDAAN